jgi:hypothetical protein
MCIEAQGWGGCKNQSLLSVGEGEETRRQTTYACMNFFVIAFGDHKL